MVKQAMKKKPAKSSSSLGGTLIGFVVGLLVGLGVALAVAVYVTRVPIPFVDRNVSRNAGQDALEAERNKGWNPNKALNGDVAAPAPAPAATPVVVAPAAAPAASGPVEVRVPDIGDFKDVAVIEVMVKPGDTIKVEQSLITVESDKASMEIPSSHAGVLKELKVKLGDKVKQGSVVVVLEAAASATPSAAASTAAPSTASLSSAPTKCQQPAVAATVAERISMVGRLALCRGIQAFPEANKPASLLTS